MSRICVKKLPKKVAEARLEDVFSQKGEITEVKLMRSKEGRSRKFAFIGFRSEHEAQEAIKYFNNSYIDTFRISVELAHKVGDENAPRPWSRHSRKNERKINENGDKSSNGVQTKRDQKRKKQPEVDDPQLEEFFDVMLRGKSKIWSNDISIAPTAEVASKENVLVKKADEPVVSNGAQHKKAKRSSDADGFDEDGMEVEDDGKMSQESKADSDDVLDTGRLFVRNIPCTTTEEELKEHFSEFGEISEVHLVLDKETKRSKGFAYIRYPTPESAARAMKKLDKSIFQGRLLHVLPAKPLETSDKQVSVTLPKTFKQKREEQRKASDAGGKNSLFMRPDTIVEYIVRMYGVSKSEFFDRESADPAVRLALAEKIVIANTKKALAKTGVNVTSLEEFDTGKGDEKNRSEHILLVKNLPFASTENELAQMFGEYGRIDKILLPPTKTMALVVFLEPAEARAAFYRMKYKRYKDAPLYLDWAPRDVLEPTTLPENNEERSDVGGNDVRKVNLEPEVEIDPEVTESNILHVTNLSFKTTDERLKKHLTDLVKQGNIRSVKIIKHVKNGKNVSSGYGFVELDSIETATSVYTDLQGTVLDGHALRLRFSENKPRDTVGRGSDKDIPSTTLIVKNVPFEATKKELRELFNDSGLVKVRLPKRNFGKHKGFAFVEFGTKQEASNAKKYFSSNHFYGRHFVIEWAEDDDSMEAKRRRSAAKYMGQENDKPKKRRRA